LHGVLEAASANGIAIIGKLLVSSYNMSIDVAREVLEVTFFEKIKSSASACVAQCQYVQITLIAKESSELSSAQQQDGNGIAGPNCGDQSRVCNWTASIAF
jgi:hypothetical protein